MCSFFPPRRTFNHARPLKDKSALTTPRKIVKRKDVGMRVRSDHRPRQRFPRLSKSVGQFAKASITMATNDLSVLRNGYQTHFEPDLPKIEKPFATISFFRGPRQSLCLNHHSVNLPAQLNAREQRVRRDSRLLIRELSAPIVPS